MLQDNEARLFFVLHPSFGPKKPLISWSIQKKFLAYLKLSGGGGGELSVPLFWSNSGSMIMIRKSRAPKFTKTQKKINFISNLFEFFEIKKNKIRIINIKILKV